MTRSLAVLAVAAIVLAPAGGSATAARDPWKQLRRPLHLPKLAVGEPCPLSTARTRLRVADALGEEPPYALPFPAATVELSRGVARRDESYAYRIRWLAPARFAGRVLVRARRIDRPVHVRFAPTAAGKPSSELRLTFTRSRRRQLRGRTWLLLRSPGCYAFQLDGLAFSDVVVFQARI